MPARWLTQDDRAPEQSGAFSLPGPPAESLPRAEVHLWPHRSLGTRGFVTFIGATAALLAVPLTAVLGTPALWALLPFMLLAIGGIWAALHKSDRDARILEVLRIWPDRIELIRQGRDGSRQEWQANPYWVTVRLHESGGPVPHYVTLRGGPREVEIGSFLSEDERIRLAQDLQAHLARWR